MFEEVAKLIIGVCYDDYEYMSTFKYIGNSTLEDTFSIVENQPNIDPVPYIIDLMVQLYCNQDLGIFQYRMLSGILSRNVRANMIPPLQV